MLDKISEAFEKKMLFRRMIIFLMMIFTMVVTYWSFDLAVRMADRSIEWNGIVSIMVTLQAPITALTGYMFKLYDNQRGVQYGTNNPH